MPPSISAPSRRGSKLSFSSKCVWAALSVSQSLTCFSGSLLHLYLGLCFLVHCLFPTVREPPLSSDVQRKFSKSRNRHYFAKKFEHIIQRQAFKRTTTTIEHPVHARTSWARRVKAFFSTVKDEATRSGSPEEKPHHTTPTTTIRPDMIRRVDGAPKLVDPSGWISQGASEDNHSDVQRHLSFADPGVISPERIRRSVERSIPTILSRR